MPRSNCYSTMALAIGDDYAAELGRGGLGRLVAKYLERGGIKPEWLMWDFDSRLNEQAYGSLIIRFNESVEVRRGKVCMNKGEEKNGYHIVKILSHNFDDGAYGIVAGEYDNLFDALREGLLASLRSFMSMGLA